MKEHGAERKRNRIWFSMGLLGTFLTVLPLLILGQEGIFTYADQLDGEMIAYILQARHLFQGSSLPEFLNGASKTALTMPAPLFVLFFLTGNYYGALVAMLLVGKVCGYAGMYLLAKETTEEAWIGAMAGFLYGCIPFLPVYGLSEFGIPLLVWCILQLKKGRHTWAAYGYTVVYALTSSLVLVGFGILGMGLLWLLWEWIDAKKRGDDKRPSRLLAAWLLLLGTYLAENCRLLGELFGLGGKTVSHKSAYVLVEKSFVSTLWQALFEGMQHCKDYHVLMLAATLIVILITVAGKRFRREGKSEKTIGICLGCNLFFALAAAFWDCRIGIGLRSHLRVLGSFQLSRLLWIAPCLWYLAASCAIALVYRQYREKGGLGSRLGLCFLVGISGASALWMLYSGDFKTNLQKLRNPDYGMLSYEDYYAIGVMDQVRDFLDETTGKRVDEYRVASLGIDPAAALYHGFYCLDGYSNHYPLDYKESFRRVIAPELDRSEYLAQYYDGWGNRCYLFSSEVPGYYTIEKNRFYFQDYRLDTGALYEMGGRYILSAAYIMNGEEQGLVLLNETPFSSLDSYYQIYVYEVTP